MAQAGLPKQRNARERAIQTLSFEVIGIALVAPLYSLFIGSSAAASMAFLATLSVIVMLWSPLHNTVFDWVDGRLTGRTASERPHHLRAVHAVSHEITAVAVTLPTVMWFSGFDVRHALAVNIGLTLVYTAYAYVFHMTFDKLRPVVAGPAPAEPAAPLTIATKTDYVPSLPQKLLQPAVKERSHGRRPRTRRASALRHAA